MGSLHQDIYEYLTGKMESGDFAPGSMLPSDSELASQFSTSRQTILRAMERLVLEGYIKRLQGKGSIVQKRSAPADRKLVSFICGDISNSFGQRVASAVEKKLGEYDYDLILSQHGHDPEKELSLIRKAVSRGVDGIIIIPANPASNLDPVKNEVMKQGINIVCVDYGYKDLQCPIVETDNYHGAYDAVSHLCKSGHKRIGFIVNTKDRMESVRTVAERFRGYRQALEDHGIKFDPALVEELGPELSLKTPREAGYKTFGYQPMNRLLRLKNPPTAVFLLWDELAFGAMAAVSDAGLKMPQDLAFAGFNDDQIALLTPVPLTSVRQPSDEIGAEAVQMLMNMIDGKPCRKHICLKNALVIRESSKR